MRRLTTRCALTMARPVLFLLLGVSRGSSAFLVTRKTDSVLPQSLPLSPLSLSTLSLTSRLLSLHSSTNSNEDDDWNVPDAEELQAERSKIPDYIAAYLRKDAEKTFAPTHLVAIPMKACHELLIELESVQRAILYHCPVLVHSCIVGSMTRLPLLYIDASYEPSGRVTMDLHDMTQRIVQKYCYSTTTTTNTNTTTTSTSTTTTSTTDAMDLVSAGDDGYKPLTLNFHKLEDDDDTHAVLYTKAVGGEEGTVKLIAMVQELKQEIQSRGWTVQIPYNPHETEFFPRIPFMRLPTDFERHLETIPDQQYRMPEQGGNGISPIFWFKWWDDYMGRAVRMRQIGIYAKRPGYTGMDESTFHIPHETIALPGANAKLSEIERKHAKYNEKRLATAEQMLDQDEADINDTLLDPALEENRRVLEAMYANDGVLTDGLVTEGLVSIGDEPYVAPVKTEKDERKQKEPKKQNSFMEQERANSNTGDVPIDSTDTPPTKSMDDSSPSRKAMSDWMQDRIRTIVESRDSVRQKQAIGIKKEDLPPFDENPILNAYKAGTLVPKGEPSSSTTTMTVPTSDPFPSQESVVGFWKMVQSPTDFAQDSGDETKTDNLVLRVDGTTSGGPILNQELQQTAAGGTWKLIQDDDGNARLRIRLVVPPKKERILVMQGLVTKGIPNVDTSASLLTSPMFGVTTNDREDESLKCRGEVWLEDALTKKNKKDIGTFFIKKIETSKDPRDFTIIIPRPVRNQD